MDDEKSYDSRYYYSFMEGDEGKKDAEEEPHLVVQMDTESSIIYQKTCLGHHYEKPLQVRQFWQYYSRSIPIFDLVLRIISCMHVLSVQLTGDVRIIFYEKLIGGRLFYVCFNTAFITGSLLQVDTLPMNRTSILVLYLVLSNMIRIDSYNCKNVIPFNVFV